MSLRFFILVLSAILIGTILYLFYFNTERILAQSFESLEETQIHTVRNTAESILQTRQYALHTYLALLENDNDLSSQLITAREFRRKSGIQSEVQRIKKKTNCDFVVLLFRDGTAFGKRPNYQQKKFKTAVKGKASYGIETVYGKQSLVGYSPLRNYGPTIGVVMMGYHLNGQIAKEISDATQTQATFVSRSPQSLAQQAANYSQEVSLTLADGNVLSAQLNIKSSFISDATRKTRSSIMWVGSISVILATFLLHLLLEFGFVKKFKQVLSSINSSATNLDRGHIYEVTPLKYPIEEITDLSQAFSKFTSSLAQFSERIKKQSKREAYVEVAEQVAHDLKSPVSALDMLLASKNAREMPNQERSLMLKCIDRIRQIIDVLNQKRQSKSIEQDKTELVAALIDSITLEKRFQLRNRTDIRIESERQKSHYGIFAKVDAQEFKRMLSNIIDNGIQAISKKGTVSISLQSSDSEIEVSVKDTGAGIPEHLIKKVLERGTSFGKENGSGLGLWHANELSKSWGGSLQIASKVDHGTTVSIHLPKSPPPLWFLDELKLTSNTEILILDDDESIHQMWRLRLRDYPAKINSFKHSGKLHQWLTAYANENPMMLLCDFELDEKKNGLEVIEAFDMESYSILVTGYHEDSKIRERCGAAGIKIIPKEFAGSIPIAFQKTSMEPASRKDIVS